MCVCVRAGNSISSHSARVSLMPSLDFVTKGDFRLLGISLRHHQLLQQRSEVSVSGSSRGQAERSGEREQFLASSSQAYFSASLLSHLSSVSLSPFSDHTDAFL